MKYSKELINKCFPHKEAILWNLAISVELANSRDSVSEIERVELLCACHRALQDGHIHKAAKLSKQAGYELMAYAIETYWGEK